MKPAASIFHSINNLACHHMLFNAAFILNLLSTQIVYPSLTNPTGVEHFIILFTELYILTDTSDFVVEDIDNIFLDYIYTNNVCSQNTDLCC